MTELPCGWSWLPLEDFGADEPNAITDGPFGSNLKTSDYVDNGDVRVIRLGNLGVGRFVDNDKSYVTSKKFNGLKKHEAKPGDLVVAALAEPVGRCVEVPEHLGTAIVKADCIRVRVHPTLDRRYLMHALNSPGGRTRAEAAAHGMGRLRINLGDLRALLVPAAPPNEQRRIVAKLEALQARSRRAREALDAIPPLLEKLRQSILAAAFRGDLTKDWREKHPDVEPASELLKRIRVERRKKWEEAELAKMKAKGRVPGDDKWKAKYKEPEPINTAGLPELPEGWCWASAEELTEATRPIIYGIIKAGPNHPGGVPYVRVTEVAAGRIVLDELPRCDPERAAKFGRSVLAAGDILVSKDGTIGKVAFVPPELEGGNINQHVLRVVAVTFINRFYLARMIEAPQCQRWMTGETKGIALQGVNVEDFRRMPVPLVPRTEQDAIVAAIDSLFESRAGAGAAYEAAAGSVLDVERSILAKAFRGELVPQDPDDEPAAVMLERVRRAQAMDDGQRGDGEETGRRASGNNRSRARTAGRRRRARGAR